MKKLNIPSLETFPQYATEKTKRDELNAKAAKNRTAVDEQHGLIQSTNTTEDKVNQAHAVADLLGDEKATGTYVDRERLKRLYAEAEAIRLAQEINRERLAGARVRASAEICKSVKPEHERLVKQICSTVIALHAATKEYHALTNELDCADIAWVGHLQPSKPRFAGEPRSNNSAMAAYLKDCAKNGFIKSTDIPIEIR